LRVLVIGAGISGLAMGVRLKRAGIDDFRILDAEDGLGGTWRVNTYPGAAVDIASTIFQFGFRTHPWRRTHATQDEVLEYLEQVAKEQGLEPHLVFGARVTEARWDDRGHEWSVTTAADATYRADVLVSAVGLLSHPNDPTWPGLPEFRGPVMHTQQWQHDVDLSGRRVAVVGVGSSSVQIVPAIAPVAESVHVFMREPGWVLPKGDRRYDDSELRRWARPWYRRLVRTREVVKKEWHNLTGRPSYHVGSKRNHAMEQLARGYIETIFGDRPDLRAAVTPDYPFEGKRVVLSSDYYPALLRDDVHLVPHPVASLTPTGIVDAAGVHHEVDVVVTATGFTAADYLATYDVFGRGGRRLRETWREGAFAHAGVTVPGYPNFYLLFGPNTNGSGAVSVFWKAEMQAAWVVADLRRMTRRGLSAVDTRAWVCAAYNVWMQRRLSRTVWATSNNYFKHSSGRNVTQFDGSITLQWLILKLGRPLGTYALRRKEAR
jgi:cation diffusion facilitator CzcD-associated flavoprotein CzcO